ncbi:chaperone protein ClpB1-like protein [Corchorus capsularis]|uniref:Chaperone protein ClpB1-like protein n=1 Tax=Corchorus capsularis TaxID=210143 RepID=A0A1R3GEW9_COCAP|nr:chaperone protein ClpB1-like protein [Corchorus capsularis]
MVRSRELSCRLADREALLEDRHFKQFKGSLIEFRDLYRKEKEKVQIVYLLRLKLFELLYKDANCSSDLLAEIQGLIDILEDLNNFPFVARSNVAGHKVDPNCMPDEVIMHEGKSNKKAKMGVDNLLMTLSEKSLQQCVATDVIENTLLKLIKDGPVNPSWGPPNSFL